MSETSLIVCPGCQATNRVPVARLGDRPRCGSCREPLFRGDPVELDDDGFRKHVSRNDIPVLVDFWAPWCGPCHMMAPAFAEAARQLEPHVRLGKLNTETAGTIAAEHGIRSIPTLALFRNGQEIARQAGAMDLPRLLNWVRANLP